MTRFQREDRRFRPERKFGLAVIGIFDFGATGKTTYLFDETSRTLAAGYSLRFTERYCEAAKC